MRAFLPNLGSLPGDDPYELRFVCERYPDCRDKPYPKSKLRPNNQRYCQTHRLPLTTQLAAPSEE